MIFIIFLYFCAQISLTTTQNLIIMRQTQRHILLAICLLAAICCQAKSHKSSADSHFLKYYKPAAVWLEALPIGNSHLGAMVYGGTEAEQIQLNEETFWSGSPHNNDSREAKQYLQEVRDSIFAGREEAAARLLDQHFLPGPHGMRFLTLGSVMLDFGDSGQAESYSRDLVLDDALAHVDYTKGGVRYHREMFASMDENVIVVRMWTDQRKPFSMTVGHRCELPSSRRTQDHCLIATVDGVEQEGIKGGLKAECRILVQADGRLADEPECVRVTDATDVTLYIVAATNFVNYHDISGDASAKNVQALAAAQKKSYAQLRARHIEKYRQQYGRVQLDLGASPDSQLATDKRLDAFGHGSGDMDLVTLMFQYGRYLLICSSQPGGQPANLQGVWNDKLNAPWDSKYTININTEMNYWIADVGNIGETQQPLFDMIRDLSVTGTRTAQTMYGCRGWVAHHNTDLWRIAGPVDGSSWGMFPNGGAWLATHLWQHFLFTGDQAFLREWYPIMKGTADFYLDYMQKDPRYGYLVVVPSVSPEHGPMGKRTPVTAGCTMDNQIVFDALSNTLAAARILGEDEAYQQTLKQTLAQLPPMQIGRHGQLQEWLQDGDNPRDQHRHISHLYGLYPSNQISPYSHPDLFTAAANTLEQRGDMATGWSLGWKINFWARMLDGDHAMKIISNMLHLLPDDSKMREYPDGRTYPNLFDAHPPFQIDGNFGCAAGIAEMLVQSHDGAVHLLPALPSAWKEGRVSGLKARGGFVVEMTWSDAALATAKVTSERGGTLRLRSYVPLKGKGLKPAVGTCDNPLLQTATVKTPLRSSELKDLPLRPVKKVYEYDIATQPGKTYRFAVAK